MKLQGVGKLRRIGNLLQGRAVVLLYHRIIEFDSDPQLLCVSPAHFAEHLDHLRRHYQLISLTALRQAVVHGSVPRRAAVVTFDDGFVDNLWNAQPLLERYGVPATVFVASGYVDLDREFPSDALERCLLRPRSLPESLTLEIEGKVHTWRLGNASVNHGAWNITMENDPTPRHRCYRELHSLLRPLSEANRHGVLEHLADWASCSTSARSDRRALNSDELRILGEDRWIEVGAHSASHLVLAEQPSKVQQGEIIAGKEQLEAILEQPVTSFSYPFGDSGDASDQTRGLVKEAGFDVACANVAGPVTSDSDLFWLPRILVRDWGAEQFAARIDMAING